MEIKDVKIGDKVQLRKDIPNEELLKLLGSSGLNTGNMLELQRRGEVTVKGIQKEIPGEEGNDWNSITLEEMRFFWPIELFEPVSNPNKVIKGREEQQVQEDILTLEGIAERYGMQYSMGGIIEYLRIFGQKYLRED